MTMLPAEGIYMAPVAQAFRTGGAQRIDIMAAVRSEKQRDQLNLAGGAVQPTPIIKAKPAKELPMSVPTADAAGKLMAKTAARAKQSQSDAAMYKLANTPTLRISMLRKELEEALSKFRASKGESQLKLAEEVTRLRSEIAKLGGGGVPSTVALDDDGNREELVELSHNSGGFSAFVDRQNAKSR